MVFNLAKKGSYSSLTVFPVSQTTEKVLGCNNTNFPKYNIFRNCTQYTSYTVGNLKKLKNMLRISFNAHLDLHFALNYCKSVKFDEYFYSFSFSLKRSVQRYTATHLCSNSCCEFSGPGFAVMIHTHGGRHTECWLFVLFVA